ncbi:MAG: hypothetical protein M1483_06755 [Actinobacteria bacterium]|nr:hypothetical protein [Actinomycetota bacterium]MCL6105307.1 hypothetical protein [Actinomycetota bacterium]
MDQYINIIKRKPIVGILILGIIVVAAIWYLVIFTSQNSKLSTLNTTESSLTTKVNGLQSTLSIEKGETQHITTYEATLARDSAAIPTHAYMAFTYKELDALGARFGVTYVNQSIATPTLSVGKPFSTISVNVTVTGSYVAVQSYIRSIYVQPRLFVIQNISLSPSGSSGLKSSVTATISMDAFTYAKPSLATP